ncbi:MAG: hypothetical protein AWM53_00085 [Candidatus Dichloromethanomonas elyunquensis]|nr:MAG: hypothetical protein AWM53_00085 [Candidatus Dichloromethanomonas elyunquensis]
MPLMNDKLVIIWTSADREVALKMVFMYGLNAKVKGWWEDVTLIVWGPSSRLLSEDEELQEYIGNMKDSGVELLACRACADQYGVTGNLERLGVNVIPMGQPLTEYLKNDIKIMTF